MRKIWMAAAVMAGLACATPATAQRVWQNGRWVVMPQRSQPMVARTNPNRWGNAVNGRWEGGMRAPGGWNAYRRLGRGHSLPNYWRGSNFRINDFQNYGLGAPPRGYFWVRYYDDAVLADDRGQVWDSLDGIGWGDSSSSSHSYSESYSNGAGYRQPIQQVDPEPYYDDAPQGYAEPIPAPYPGGYAPPVAAPPVVHYQQGYGQQGGAYQGSGAYQGGAYQGGTFYGGSAQQGSSSTYYSSGSSGYVQGGGSTTTVIITPAPVTTTTVTEEVIQEYVTTTHVRAAPRRAVRRAPVRKWRPKPKPKCCVCVCR